MFFQVWNQINCRSLTPDDERLQRPAGATRRSWRSPARWRVVQVLIVSVPFLGDVFKVEPLGLLDWLCILAGTASVLVFAEAARLIRLRFVPA